MNRTQGFTLIEVLVAMLVMAIGLLGLAGLQMKSLNSTQETYFQTQADLLINDLITRIRANKSGTYTQADKAINSFAAAGKNCLTATCSQAEIVAWDYDQWSKEALRILGGKPAVIDVSQTGSLYQITLKANIFNSLDNAGNLISGANCSGDETVDMYCSRLTAHIQ